MIITLTVPDSALSRELVDTLRDIIGDNDAVVIGDRRVLRGRNHSPDHEIEVVVMLTAESMMPCSRVREIISQLAACELPPAEQRLHAAAANRSYISGQFSRGAGSQPLAGQMAATPATRAIDMSRIWSGADLWAYDATNVIQIAAASKADCLAAVEHIAQHLQHYWTQAGSNGHDAYRAPLVSAARWLQQQPCWQALVTAAAGSSVSPKLFQFLRDYLPNVLVKFSPPQSAPPLIAAAAASGRLLPQKRRIEL